MAVNDSWKLVPWATALYACDLAWWRLGCAFEGERYSITQGTERQGARLVPIRRARRTDDMVLTDPPTIATGGNSGFQALNLAVQLGARQIVMVGYDMRLDQGIHWHGPHKKLRNPTQPGVTRWRDMLDRQAGRLAAHGAEVINASPASALAAYRKMSLEDALGYFRGTGSRVRQVRAGLSQPEISHEAGADGGRG